MTKKTKKLKQILDKISTTEEKFFDAIENGEEIAKEEALKAYKALSTPEEKVMDFLENIENFKGKDGKTPTPEELQAIIKPLIPKSIPGKDGKTLTDEEVIAFIKPLIPPAIPGKDGNVITPEEVRDKLKLLKGDEKLSVLDLKDLEWLKTKDGMSWASAGFKVYTDSTLTGDGSFANPLKVASTPATAFINLTDAPHSYTGEAGKAVYVNGTETGLIFQTAVSSDEKIKITANDTTPSYLNSKISVSGGLTTSITNPGGNEILNIDASGITPDLSGQLHLDQTTPQTFTGVLAGSGLFKVTAGLVGLDTNTYLTSSDLSGYVPYTGGTNDIDLNHNILISANSKYSNWHDYDNRIGGATQHYSELYPERLRLGTFDGASYVSQWDILSRSNGNLNISGTGSLIELGNSIGDSANSKLAIDIDNRVLYKQNGSTASFDFQNLKFPTLTTNGLLKTSGSDGTIGVDTTTQGLAASAVQGTPWTSMGYLTSITADSPLSGAGTSASHLVIAQANTSTDGYLSSTDWNTFNNKQPAGTYITLASLSGTAPITYNNTTGAIGITSADATHAGSVPLSSTPGTNTYLRATQTTGALSWQQIAYGDISGTPSLTGYALLDGSNQPFTGNINISKTLPELRLTATGSDYMRQYRSATTNYGYQYNRVSTPGGTEAVIFPTSDGGSSGMSVPDSNAFSFGSGGTDTPFSISAWIYLPALVTHQEILSKIDASNNTEWELLVQGGAVYLIVYTTGSLSNYVTRYTSAILSINTWYHIVGTYDGSKAGTGMKIYVNNVQRDNATYNGGLYTGMSNTVAPVGIGNRYNGSYYGLQGTIDEVNMFNSVLSSGDVGTLWNGGAGLFGVGAISNQIAGWHFDEGTGSTVADSSGNGHTATFYGTPAWTSAGKVTGTATMTEIPVWSSKDGVASFEQGITTFGTAAGQTNLNYGTTQNIISNSTTVGNWTSGGLFTVGATAGTGKFNIVGNADIVQLKVIANATQTNDVLDLFQSDGTTKIASIDNTGNLFLKGTAKIKPTVDSTTALNIANAAGTAQVTFDTTNGRVGIGTTAPSTKLHIISTTEQLRLGYDVNNYKSETVGSTGSVTTALTGTSPINIFNQNIKAPAYLLTDGSDKNYTISVINQGLPYTLTGSSAEVGSTSLTINKAGTYRITARAQVTRTNGTHIATHTITYKLTRTNNTPTDLSPTTTYSDDAHSMSSESEGNVIFEIPTYTTANTNDIIQLYGILTGATGGHDVDEASIICQRLY